jgi:hypothetical protein
MSNLVIDEIYNLAILEINNRNVERMGVTLIKHKSLDLVRVTAIKYVKLFNHRESSAA